MAEALAIPEGLTEMQAKLVEGIMHGLPERDALRGAGYSDTTLPAAILGSKAVQKAIEAACEAKLRGPLRAKALETIEELLDKSTPAATRFQAAKFIAEQSAPEKEGDKPLSEMTIDELEALIRSKETALKDVTPRNGASSAPAQLPVP